MLSALRRAGHTMATTPSADTVKIALCQILSGSDKLANLKTAVDAIHDAAAQNAKIVALPECFNSTYATDQFPLNAEPIPRTKAELDPKVHISTAALSAAAAANGVYLIGGSIPEVDEQNRVYNTCVAFGPDGEILAKHRKMHLFDINIPGGITFRESDTLTGGDTLSTFDSPYGRIGIAICYDIRFPLLAMLLRKAGCRILVYPGAFNLVTGPVHWELLQRSRALDTQCFVAGVSPARNMDASYKSWGHSTVVSPWGEVIATRDETPGTVFAELNLRQIDEVRARVPVGIQARTDLYSLEFKAEKQQ